MKNHVSIEELDKVMQDCNDKKMSARRVSESCEKVKLLFINIIFYFTFYINYYLLILFFILLFIQIIIY